MPRKRKPASPPLPSPLGLFSYLPKVAPKAQKALDRDFNDFLKKRKAKVLRELR